MIKQIKNTGGNWPTMNETLVNSYLQIFLKFVNSIDYRFPMTLYYIRQIGRQTDRYQRMYVNIINYKTRHQNVVIDVIMNLHYSLVIIKCKTYCKTKA